MAEIDRLCPPAGRRGRPFRPARGSKRQVSGRVPAPRLEVARPEMRLISPREPPPEATRLAGSPDRLARSGSCELRSGRTTPAPSAACRHRPGLTRLASRPSGFSQRTWLPRPGRRRSSARRAARSDPRSQTIRRARQRPARSSRRRPPASRAARGPARAPEHHARKERDEAPRLEPGSGSCRVATSARECAPRPRSRTRAWRRRSGGAVTDPAAASRRARETVSRA